MAPGDPLHSKKHFSFATTLLPTIGNMIFVALLFVLVFNSGNGLLGDGDTGYHIRTGELILKEWRIPALDPYSYHVPPLKWTAHEWLAEVIMAIIHSVSGLTGIVLFFSVLLTLIHWYLYRILREESKDIILCTIITLLAATTSSSHWLARPHVFSLFLTLLWYHLLNQFQYKDRRTLVYLPLIMLLWANLHAGFIMGLILLGIYLAGNAITACFGSPSEACHARQKLRPLAFCIAATALVSLINPIGYKLLVFPFHLTADQFVMDRVAEFLSPNFHEVLPFKYMFLAMLVSLALARSPLNSIQLGVLALLSYMALYSVRHVSLYAILVAPILLNSSKNIANYLPGSWLKAYHQRNANLATVEQNLSAWLWPSAAILLPCVLALTGQLHYEFNRKIFPVAAVNFLQRENISGNMFNNDEFGDYMIFSIWPKYRVFMDGRSDMYGEKYGSAYLKVANALPGWKEILAQYKIDWIIVETRSSLTSILIEQNDWQAIYSDQIATIFLKKNVANQSILTRYSDVKVDRPSGLSRSSY
jgi:hypothetical protein